MTFSGLFKAGRAGAGSTPQIGSCEEIIITTANGKVYNLGQPDSLLFSGRVFIYRLRRWREFLKGQKNG